MLNQLRAWLMVAVLTAASAVVQAQDWGQFPNVSATMGINDGRVCVGEASRGDLGCPTYAPYVSATSGWVGIGTTNPAANLEIANSIGNSILRVRKAGGSYAYLNLSDGTAGNDWRVYNYYDEKFSIQHGTQSTGRFLNIDISGNTGLRTAEPSSTLHVNGGIRLAMDSSATTNTCDTDRSGAIRYNGSTFQVCYGTGGWANLTDASGTTTTADRIISGTAQMIANGNSNSISITEAGVTTGYYYNGIWVAGGVSTTGPISATNILATQGLAISSTDRTLMFNVNNGANSSGYGYLASIGTPLMIGKGGFEYGKLALRGGSGQTGYIDFASSKGLNIYSVSTNYMWLASEVSGGSVGRVAINTSYTLNPYATLEVSGTVKLGYSGEACDTYRAGAIRYVSPTFQVCYGTGGWANLTDASGTTVTDRLVSGTSSAILAPSGNLTVRGLIDLVTGTNTVGIGQNAATSNSGTNVTALGSSAVQNNTTGNATGVGYAAGQYNTGTNLTANGYTAGRNNTGDNLTAVGTTAATNNSGTNVTAIGASAATNNSNSNVTALGYGAGQSNAGAAVTVAGSYAAQANTGSNLTAMGYTAGRYNSAANITAIGYAAGTNNSAINLTAIGVYAASANSGTNVTAMGYQSAEYNTGNNVTGLGTNAALYNTGDRNTAAGTFAMQYKVAGTDNAVFGSYAGLGVTNTTAYSQNSLFGSFAGTALTTGSSNTLIGYNSGAGITTGNGNITLGFNLSPFSNTGDNQLNIGNSIFGNIGGGAALKAKIGVNVTSPTQSLEVSGTISATNFVGNGSGLTGVIAAGSDRITSGTAQVIANSNSNSISITEAGVTTGYYYGGKLVAGGVSTTGTVSATNVYATVLQLADSPANTCGPGTYGTMKMINGRQYTCRP
ncbi:hypothetical protein NKH72_30165 [Mesorhizobium sp. M0955]|uniref:beta strand repeat-containing protein n=1 Tax=Mesorhizobium sp. M0955 TaxID=2957033 RepID=UPI00333CBA82